MTLKVIDVSQYNGTIAWKNVKGNVDAAIIRAGYRGYGSVGTLATDKKFKENAAAANSLQIPVGVYWLSQALNEAEAKAEAVYLIKLLKSYKITFPVYLDSEYCEPNGNGRGDRIGKTQRTKNGLAFLKAIKAAGYTAGLYCAESWFTDEIDGAAIRKAGYTIWCARLAGKPRIGTYDAWQYTWGETVPGILGKVDMSYFYKDFAETSEKKTAAEVAEEVIRGSWGNGAERRQRLESAGYDYEEVRAAVNEIFKSRSRQGTGSRKCQGIF